MECVNRIPLQIVVRMALLVQSQTAQVFHAAQEHVKRRDVRVDIIYTVIIVRRMTPPTVVHMAHHVQKRIVQVLPAAQVHVKQRDAKRDIP